MYTPPAHLSGRCVEAITGQVSVGLGSHGIASPDMEVAADKAGRYWQWQRCEWARSGSAQRPATDEESQSNTSTLPIVGSRADSAVVHTTD
jgi:hypothetical protein